MKCPNNSPIYALNGNRSIDLRPNLLTQGCTVFTLRKKSVLVWLFVQGGERLAMEVRQAGTAYRQAIRFREGSSVG